MGMDIRTGLLMGFPIGLLMLAGFLLGGGNQYVVLLFFLFALMINVVMYWCSDRLVLKMYRAKVLDEGDDPVLQNMVSRLARQADIPKPKVAIIPSDIPNAFATGRGPSSSAVVLTKGAQDLLSENELEGVLSHEITHIKNHDTLVMVLAAVIAGAIGYLAFWARWSLFMGGDRRNDGGTTLLSLIFLAVFIPLTAIIIRMAISRSREYLADRGVAEISGRPGYLAVALEWIEGYVRRRSVKDGKPATSHLFIVNPSGTTPSPASSQPIHPPRRG